MHRRCSAAVSWGVSVEHADERAPRCILVRPTTRAVDPAERCWGGSPPAAAAQQCRPGPAHRPRHPTARLPQRPGLAADRGTGRSGRCRSRGALERQRQPPGGVAVPGDGLGRYTAGGQRRRRRPPGRRAAAGGLGCGQRLPRCSAAHCRGHHGRRPVCVRLRAADLVGVRRGPARGARRLGHGRARAGGTCGGVRDQPGPVGHCARGCRHRRFRLGPAYRPRRVGRADAGAVRLLPRGVPPADQRGLQPHPCRRPALGGCRDRRGAGVLRRLPRGVPRGAAGGSAALDRGARPGRARGRRLGGAVVGYCARHLRSTHCA